MVPRQEVTKLPTGSRRGAASGPRQRAEGHQYTRKSTEREVARTAACVPAPHHYHPLVVQVRASQSVAVFGTRSEGSALPGFKTPRLALRAELHTALSLCLHCRVHSQIVTLRTILASPFRSVPFRSVVSTYIYACLKPYSISILRFINCPRPSSSWRRVARGFLSDAFRDTAERAEKFCSRYVPKRGRSRLFVNGG